MVGPCAAKVGRTLCTDLQSLLDQHQVDVVDFLSVDTGGSELDVLLSVDFEKTAVNVVCVSDTERKVCLDGLHRLPFYSVVFTPCDEAIPPWAR